MPLTLGAYHVATIRAGSTYCAPNGKIYTAHGDVPRGHISVDSEYDGARFLYRLPPGTTAAEARRAISAAFEAKVAGLWPYYTATREG